MPFNFKPLQISDLVLIEPVVFKDERGFFLESYKLSDFNKAGIGFHFVQDNHSKKGVLKEAGFISVTASRRRSSLYFCHCESDAVTRGSLYFFQHWKRKIASSLTLLATTDCFVSLALGSASSQ